VCASASPTKRTNEATTFHRRSEAKSIPNGKKKITKTALLLLVACAVCFQYKFSNIIAAIISPPLAFLSFRSPRRASILALFFPPRLSARAESGRKTISFHSMPWHFQKS
jgi:hypothetical protein